MMERRVDLTPEQTEMLVGLVYKSDKGQFIGPFLIGVALDLLLFGVVLHQFSHYWTYCMKEDRWFTKSIVFTAMILTLGCSICSITYGMRLFVYNYGVYSPMADPHWPQLFAVIDALICPLTQAIYVDRAYRLLANTHQFPVHKVFLTLMVFLMFSEIVAGVGAIIYVNVAFKSLLDAFKLAPFLYAALSTAMTADLSVTLFTSYALWRSKTGWAHTDSVIYKLIRFLFETQAPPTIMAIAFLIYYTRNGASTVIIAFSIAMTKPYVIGLLSVLNSRQGLRRDMLNQSRSGGQVYQNKSLPRHDTLGVRYNDSHLAPPLPFAPGVTLGSSSRRGSTSYDHTEP